jgi:hypothetical protein
VKERFIGNSRKNRKRLTAKTPRTQRELKALPWRLGRFLNP